MAKYSKKKADKICSLIRKDSYTIIEICSLSRISKETYYRWLEEKPDFRDAVTRAKEEYDDMLIAEAKKSLVKKVQGYTVKETKIVTVDSGRKDEAGKPIPKIKEQVTIDKTFQPDTVAITFVLTNKVPEEYKNRVNNELTGKDGKDLFAKMTDDELDKKITDLEAKKNN